MNITDAYERFEQDVPEHLREDAMQMMCEASAQCCEHESVHILDRDRLDAINVRAHGTIRIEGEEYTFHMEDGDRAGTVLLAWNEDKEFVHHQPTRWALQPSDDLVDKAIEKGNGPFLIAKWDAMLTRSEIGEIPGKYGYDRHFQPGGKVESYWKAEAAKHRFKIVTQETADETRKRLQIATP